jgi:hypothetical protein
MTQRVASEIEDITSEVDGKFNKLISLLRAKHVKRRVTPGFIDHVAGLILSRLRKQGVIRPNESRVRTLARQAVVREFLRREAGRYS